MQAQYDSSFGPRYPGVAPVPIVVVVVPCFRVRKHILSVLASLDPRVRLIIAVDDACPEHSGNFIREHCRDPRVEVIRHELNQGVGGAVMTGYRRAIERGADIIVKVDGDGQMDPALLPKFLAPILAGRADYTKGNRFYDLAKIGRMPAARLFGNAVLSFVSKLSCGYWNIFDPTNGYTAIHARVAALLPFENISRRYFFETDMLFRLNTYRAVVEDVPMDAVYGEEQSGIRISRIIGEFLLKHARNFGKRIFYNYFLRDMTVASIELVAGMSLLVFGIVFGLYHWTSSYAAGIATPVGTVMLAVLPILVGLQLVLAFLSYDIANLPTRPIGESLQPVKTTPARGEPAEPKRAGVEFER